MSKQTLLPIETEMRPYATPDNLHPTVAAHCRINRVIYSPEQIARIVSEIPRDGIPEKTASGYELAAYRMPNGSRFVTLSDGSRETWELYAEELRSRCMKGGAK